MAALTESFVSGGIFGETTKALRQSWNQRVVETDQDILVDELNIGSIFRSRCRSLGDVIFPVSKAHFPVYKRMIQRNG